MEINLSQNPKLEIETQLELALSPKMLAMLKILNLPFQELMEKISREVEENVMLEVEHPDHYAEMLNFIGAYKKQKKQIDFSNLPGIENLSRVHQTLEQHLLEQLKLEKLTPQHQAIAETLIGHLDTRGYIVNYPAVREEIEKTHSVSRPTVDKMLKIVQSFEPDGVGARDLKECLQIQVAEYGIESSALLDIIEQTIQHHLEDLGEGNFEKIAHRLGVKTEGIRQVADFIRNNLNPNPGSLFGTEERQIVPSFSLHENADGTYRVINLEATYGPQLSISTEYEKMLRSHPDEQTIAFLKEKLARAQELIAAIKKRQATHHQILDLVVKKQNAFFKKGANWIQPLLQKDLAALLDLHPSTVSRALAGKYLQTKKGVFHLKYLCQRAWHGVTKTRMQELITEILQQEKNASTGSDENREKRLSDEGLKKRLAEKGINASRRTIAEYRKQLNIPSSLGRNHRRQPSAESVDQHAQN